MDGSYCPSSSLTLCPVRDQEEEEEEEVEEEEESMRALNSEVFIYVVKSPTILDYIFRL